MASDQKFPEKYQNIWIFRFKVRHQRSTNLEYPVIIHLNSLLKGSHLMLSTAKKFSLYLPIFETQEELREIIIDAINDL